MVKQKDLFTLLSRRYSPVIAVLTSPMVHSVQNVTGFTFEQLLHIFSHSMEINQTIVYPFEDNPSFFVKNKYLRFVPMAPVHVNFPQPTLHEATDKDKREKHDLSPQKGISSISACVKIHCKRYKNLVTDSHKTIPTNAKEAKEFMASIPSSSRQIMTNPWADDVFGALFSLYSHSTTHSGSDKTFQNIPNTVLSTIDAPAAVLCATTTKDKYAAKTFSLLYNPNNPPVFLQQSASLCASRINVIIHFESWGPFPAQFVRTIEKEVGSVLSFIIPDISCKIHHDETSSTPPPPSTPISTSSGLSDDYQHRPMAISSPKTPQSSPSVMSPTLPSPPVSSSSIPLSPSSSVTSSAILSALLASIPLTPVLPPLVISPIQANTLSSSSSSPSVHRVGPVSPASLIPSSLALSLHHLITHVGRETMKNIQNRMVLAQKRIDGKEKGIGSKFKRLFKSKEADILEYICGRGGSRYSSQNDSQKPHRRLPIPKFCSPFPSASNLSSPLPPSSSASSSLPILNVHTVIGANRALCDSLLMIGDYKRALTQYILFKAESSKATPIMSALLEQELSVSAILMCLGGTCGDRDIAASHDIVARMASIGGVHTPMGPGSPKYESKSPNPVGTGSTLGVSTAIGQRITSPLAKEALHPPPSSSSPSAISMTSSASTSSSKCHSPANPMPALFPPPPLSHPLLSCPSHHCLSFILSLVTHTLSTVPMLLLTHLRDLEKVGDSFKRQIFNSYLPLACMSVILVRSVLDECNDRVVRSVGFLLEGTPNMLGNVFSCLANDNFLSNDERSENHRKLKEKLSKLRSKSSNPKVLAALSPSLHSSLPSLLLPYQYQLLRQISMTLGVVGAVAREECAWLCVEMSGWNIWKKTMQVFNKGLSGYSGSSAIVRVSSSLSSLKISGKQALCDIFSPSLFGSLPSSLQQSLLSLPRIVGDQSEVISSNVHTLTSSIQSTLQNYEVSTLSQFSLIPYSVKSLPPFMSTHFTQYFPAVSSPWRHFSLHLMWSSFLYHSHGLFDNATRATLFGLMVVTRSSSIQSSEEGQHCLPSGFSHDLTSSSSMSVPAGSTIWRERERQFLEHLRMDIRDIMTKKTSESGTFSPSTLLSQRSPNISTSLAILERLVVLSDDPRSQNGYLELHNEMTGKMITSSSFSSSKAETKQDEETSQLSPPVARPISLFPALVPSSLTLSSSIPFSKTSFGSSLSVCNGVVVSPLGETGDEWDVITNTERAQYDRDRERWKRQERERSRIERSRSFGGGTLPSDFSPSLSPSSSVSSIETAFSQPRALSVSLTEMDLLNLSKEAGITERMKRKAKEREQWNEKGKLWLQKEEEKKRKREELYGPDSDEFVESMLGGQRNPVMFSMPLTSVSDSSEDDSMWCCQGESILIRVSITNPLVCPLFLSDVSVCGSIFDGEGEMIVAELDALVKADKQREKLKKGKTWKDRMEDFRKTVNKLSAGYKERLEEEKKREEERKRRRDVMRLRREEKKNRKKSRKIREETEGEDLLLLREKKREEERKTFHDIYSLLSQPVIEQSKVLDLLAQSNSPDALKAVSSSNLSFRLPPRSRASLTFKLSPSRAGCLVLLGIRGNIAAKEKDTSSSPFFLPFLSSIALALSSQSSSSLPTIRGPLTMCSVTMNEEGESCEIEAQNAISNNKAYKLFIPIIEAAPSLEMTARMGSRKDDVHGSLDAKRSQYPSNISYPSQSLLPITLTIHNKGKKRACGIRLLVSERERVTLSGGHSSRLSLASIESVDEIGWKMEDWGRRKEKQWRAERNKRKTTQDITTKASKRLCLNIDEFVEEELKNCRDTHHGCISSLSALANTSVSAISFSSSSIATLSTLPIPLPSLPPQSTISVTLIVHCACVGEWNIHFACGYDGEDHWIDVSNLEEEEAEEEAEEGEEAEEEEREDNDHIPDSDSSSNGIPSEIKAMDPSLLPTPPPLPPRPHSSLLSHTRTAHASLSISLFPSLSLSLNTIREKDRRGHNCVCTLRAWGTGKESWTPEKGKDGVVRKRKGRGRILGLLCMSDMWQCEPWIDKVPQKTHSSISVLDESLFLNSSQASSSHLFSLSPRDDSFPLLLTSLTRAQAECVCEEVNDVERARKNRKLRPKNRRQAQMVAKLALGKPRKISEVVGEVDDVLELCSTVAATDHEDKESEESLSNPKKSLSDLERSLPSVISYTSLSSSVESDKVSSSVASLSSLLMLSRKRREREQRHRDELIRDEIFGGGYACVDLGYSSRVAPKVKHSVRCVLNRLSEEKKQKRKEFISQDNASEYEASLVPFSSLLYSCDPCSDCISLTLLDSTYGSVLNVVEHADKERVEKVEGCVAMLRDWEKEKRRRVWRKGKECVDEFDVCVFFEWEEEIEEEIDGKTVTHSISYICASIFPAQQIPHSKLSVVATPSHSADETSEQEEKDQWCILDECTRIVHRSKIEMGLEFKEEIPPVVIKKGDGKEISEINKMTLPSFIFSSVSPFPILSHPRMCMAPESTDKASFVLPSAYLTGSAFTSWPLGVVKIMNRKTGKIPRLGIRVQCDRVVHHDFGRIHEGNQPAVVPVTVHVRNEGFFPMNITMSPIGDHHLHQHTAKHLIHSHIIGGDGKVRNREMVLPFHTIDLHMYIVVHSPGVVECGSILIEANALVSLDGGLCVMQYPKMKSKAVNVIVQDISQ
ncbi:hypothetical protein ADUPG1_013274 [Aduncisulcus paluster]|uniref:Uncharacterized protein n=1 Tax=Aduncisulcus paluster TaxID=2918883 RepID=A0ABQ5K738_9EUKA|nr:hypothetical protein ADUPG1_013274 [Aduncisulcus paluster]